MPDLKSLLAACAPAAPEFDPTALRSRIQQRSRRRRAAMSLVTTMAVLIGGGILFALQDRSADTQDVLMKGAAPRDRAKPTSPSEGVEPIAGIEGAEDVTAGPDGVLVTGRQGPNREDRYVLRYDAPAGRDVWRRAIKGVSHRIAHRAGLTWVVGGGDGAEPVGTVVALAEDRRIEGGQIIIASYAPDAGFSAYDVAVVGFEAWVTSPTTDEVARFYVGQHGPLGARPGLAMKRVAVGDQPTDIVATSDGALWVHESLAGTIARIDPDSEQVTARYQWQGRILAAGNDSTIWVTDLNDPSTLIQLQPDLLGGPPTAAERTRISVGRDVLAAAAGTDDLCAATAVELLCWEFADIAKGITSPSSRAHWANREQTRVAQLSVDASGVWLVANGQLFRWTS